MKPKVRKATVCYALALFLGAGLASLQRCETPPKADAIEAGQADLDASYKIIADAAAKAATEEHRIAYTAQMDGIRADVAALAAAREGLKAAESTGAKVGEAVTVVGASVPVPIFNTIVGLLGGTGVITAVATWLAKQKWAKVANAALENAVKYKQIASELMAGLNNAKTSADNPAAKELAASLDRSKAFIHAKMTPENVDIVRRAIAPGTVVF